jgi:hypothetical protein
MAGSIGRAAAVASTGGGDGGEARDESLMVGTAITIQSMRASVGALAAEHARLSSELMGIERRMAVTRSGAEARSLDERMAATKQALRALDQEQTQKEEAERRQQQQAAAAAARARLTGHARALADAHAAKLTALETAEAHMQAAVAAINEALAQEAAERAAATAMAAEMNVETKPLNLSGDEAVRRLGGNICGSLLGISACNRVARRLGAWVLPMRDPDLRAGEGWAEREARHTSGSVELLLEHDKAAAA